MGSQQTARQVARRAALDVQARMRSERAEQDKRRSALGVVVVQALAERDATTAACEQRAGKALRSLVSDEGLSFSQALAWCGDELSKREATRLRRLAGEPGPSDGGSKPHEQLAVSASTTTGVVPPAAALGEAAVGSAAT